jgi:hypothetical protein
VEAREGIRGNLGVEAGSGSFAGASKREDTKKWQRNGWESERLRRIDQGGDLPGGIKLDEEHFGGERILHVGSIPRVRGIGIAANVWLCGFFYMFRFCTRFGYGKRISQS